MPYTPSARLPAARPASRPGPLDPDGPPGALGAFRSRDALVGALRSAGDRYADALAAQGCGPELVRARVRRLVDVAVAAEGWDPDARATRALADALLSCAVEGGCST